MEKKYTGEKNQGMRKISEELSFAERLAYLASHDELTGILNRSGFDMKVREILREAKNNGRHYAVTRWNIEDFKLLNEMFGRRDGDRILQFFPTLFKELNIPGAVFGRLESDHFVLFFDADCYDISRLGEFIDKMSHKYGLSHYVKIKVGIYYVDDFGMDIDHMIDCANIAAMTIKGKRTSCYAVFTEDMRREMVHSEEISAGLERALQKEEIEVYLQPVVDAQTKQVVGAEVLSRWNHEKKGFLNPVSFIPYLEKNGLIVKLDYYMWKKTFEILCHDQMSQHPEISLSVNMSRSMLEEERALKLLSNLMEEYKVDPKRLKVELTESTYMYCTEELTDTVQKLRKLGFAVMMDDFGTGFSSLSVLRKIPMDCLKIDISFVQDILQDKRTRMIVENVITMARELGMTTIAEGVETREQEELLCRVGCDRIQGYYHAKPMPVAEFEAKYCV